MAADTRVWSDSCCQKGVGEMKYFDAMAMGFMATLGGVAAIALLVKIVSMI